MAPSLFVVYDMDLLLCELPRKTKSHVLQACLSPTEDKSQSCPGTLGFIVIVETSVLLLVLWAQAPFLLISFVLTCHKLRFLKNTSYHLSIQYDDLVSEELIPVKFKVPRYHFISLHADNCLSGISLELWPQRPVFYLSWKHCKFQCSNLLIFLSLPTFHVMAWAHGPEAQPG
jgi:hypothetical protein